MKVLAWYRPDASPSVRVKQKDFAKRIGDHCNKYDIPYLFELLVYPLPGEANQTTDYIEMTAKHADHVLESVRTFAPESTASTSSSWRARAGKSVPPPPGKAPTRCRRSTRRWASSRAGRG